MVFEKGIVVSAFLHYINKEGIGGKNKYNPVLDLLAKAPEWDGHDRLPELYDIMKINDFDDLSKTLIHKWLLMSLALLENRFDNAFGADGILVIQGPQGIGKTSLVSKLGLSPKYTKIGLLNCVD